MSFKELEQKLELTFKNQELIRTAFTHRSFLNESLENKESNERLEFLGDSILSFIVSRYLYKTYPNLPEGELTSFRSSIVKTTTLAEIARTLDLGSMLKLSKGEDEGGGRSNISILADTFEALLGAIFLDQGIENSEAVIMRFLLPKLSNIIEKKSYKDAKSSLQEMVQETTRTSPIYKVMKEIGPDHSKTFTTGVYLGVKLLGEGVGKSKQEAEQNAAAEALEKWQKE